MLGPRLAAVLREAAIATLCLFALPFCAATRLHAPSHVSLDHDEGSKAYRADASCAGNPLDPYRHDLAASDYPPLCFVIVASVGKRFGALLGAGSARTRRARRWSSATGVSGTAYSGFERPPDAPGSVAIGAGLVTAAGLPAIPGYRLRNLRMTPVPSVSILGITQSRDTSAHGGGPVVAVNLANYLAQCGVKVQVPVFTRLPRDRLPFRFDPAVDVTVLHGQSRLALFAQIVTSLRRHRPQVVLAGGHKADVLAARAGLIPGLRFDLWAWLHHHLSSEMAGWPEAKRRRRVRAWRWVIRRAKGVITVSQGIADDLIRVTGCPPQKVTVIYNPIIHPRLAARLEEPPDHPWLTDGGPPVVLGVGRLVGEKDFQTLIRAFALVHTIRPARLLLIGEGEERARLAEQALSLGLGKVVDLPGFRPNPLPYMRAARLLVLPSRTEGFGNVLVEALYCGTPIVSTDCPSGPREILGDGRYGRLVPVGDSQSMASAILETLRAPPERERLRARAMEFSVERSAERYCRIMGLIRQPPATV
jgi:glycosyltransferase involved in cell wall biosynthesis